MTRTRYVSGAADGCDAGAHPDGVLLRLASLPKGRTLLARAFSALIPPKQLLVDAAWEGEAPKDKVKDAGLRLVYGVLRNCRALFGPITWLTAQVSICHLSMTIGAVDRSAGTYFPCVLHSAWYRTLQCFVPH